MNIFLYLDKDTWVHRLDPRTKILGALIGFAICLCFNHPLYMAAISFFFLSTTRNEELTNGLIRMGLPYPIAFALSTALRLVPTFAGAGATIVQGQVSRGLG